MELPPPALALALLAMLLAIVAAAGPFIARHGRSIGRITIIVDRGLTMSATDASGKPRFISSAEQAAQAIAEIAPDSSIDLKITPGGIDRENAGPKWIDLVRSTAGTAMRDTSTLSQLLRSSVAATDGVVIVITDQRLDITSRNIVQFAPKTGIRNVGIVSIAVRPSPTPCAMVTVRNQSELKSCELKLQADDRIVETPIALPGTGKTQNYFIDLPGQGQIVRAELLVADDLNFDHRAWTVRQWSNPRIEARSGLPMEIQRIIEIYARQRPPTESSRSIAVIASSSDVPSDVPVAIVGDAHSRATLLPALQPIVIDGSTDIPDNIDWMTIARSSAVADLPHGDWKPIVSIAGHPMVAIRETPMRQVWIGFESTDFPRTPDFVVFWTHIFQWLNNGIGQAGEYVSRPPERLDEHWKQIEPADAPSLPAGDIGLVPGLYRLPDGTLRAINAAAPELETSPGVDGPAAFKNLQARDQRLAIYLRAPVTLAALVMMAISMWTWQAIRANAAAKMRLPEAVA